MPRTYTEIVVLFLFLGGIGLMVLGSFIGAALIVLSIILAFASIRTVPAQPPSVAMPTFLGARYDELIREGIVLVCPGIEDLIIKDFLPEEKTLMYDEVRCQMKGTDGQRISGGSVTVEVSFVYVPDVSAARRFRLFLNNGGREKIDSIVEGMLGEAIRQQASMMTWEEITFAKAGLSADLIRILTDLTPEEGADDAVVKAFLQKALVNGVADVKDLGISVRRVNVVEVEPEGKLKENAEKQAIELLQRTAETTDVGTGINLTQDLLEAAQKHPGGVKEFLEFYKLQQVDRARRSAVSVDSSGTQLLDATALLKSTAPPQESEEDTTSG